MNHDVNAGVPLDELDPEDRDRYTMLADPILQRITAFLQQHCHQIDLSGLFNPNTTTATWMITALPTRYDPETGVLSVTGVLQARLEHRDQVLQDLLGIAGGAPPDGGKDVPEPPHNPFLGMPPLGEDPPDKR